MNPQVTSIDFHFDIMCPYAYQTSKWIRDVRHQNGIEHKRVVQAGGYGVPTIFIDERAIAATPKPYIEARNWVSIDRGVEVGFGQDGFHAVGPADRKR